MTTAKPAKSLDYCCPNLQKVWTIIARSLDYRCQKSGLSLPGGKMPSAQLACNQYLAIDKNRFASSIKSIKTRELQILRFASLVYCHSIEILIQKGRLR
jgi:hypothetical protein